VGKKVQKYSDYCRWSLLTFVNGIANLASSDHNKEIIGQSGIIEILFDILQVDAKKCTHGRVLTYLDESKATSATVSICVEEEKEGEAKGRIWDVKIRNFGS
jgi:hypothetical protein